MDDDVVVARLGRPHGVRGELTIEVRTDRPEALFVAGETFRTDPDMGTVTLLGARDHNGTLLLTLEEIPDRAAAENARDVLLLARRDDSDEPDAWYDAQLVGLEARLSDGRAIGRVVGVEHGALQDLLVIAEPGATAVRLPFVAALVPSVEPGAGFIVIDPPGGLFRAVPQAEI